MKKKRFILRLSVLGIILVVLIIPLVYAVMNDAGSTPRVGDTASDFALKKAGGKTVKLSDYRGQGVFINFWATWCEPCREEMPAMQREYEQRQGEDIEILAVNIAESELAASRFAEQYGLGFPILLDTDRTVTQQYVVGPIPSSYFLDENGTIVEHFEGQLSEQQIKNYIESIQP